MIDQEVQLKYDKYIFSKLFTRSPRSNDTSLDHPPALVPALLLPRLAHRRRVHREVAPLLRRHHLDTANIFLLL